MKNRAAYHKQDQARRRSIPARIEAIGRREDASHAGHQRLGVMYKADCEACQRRQLGELAEGQLHAVRNPVHRQWHYPPCQ